MCLLPWKMLGGRVGKSPKETREWIFMRSMSSTMTA
jgi:hypothetical protein